MSDDISVSNRTSPLAWIELVCVILLNMSINLRWLTFSPVATVATEYLQVDMSAITWLANCATLIYIGISASTGWVFEKFGMKYCVRSLGNTYIKRKPYKIGNCF
jgi:FLVCR family MFS transporter 7